MDNKFNYYANEISKLDLTSQYPVSLKIWDGEGNSTKQMSINRESIQEFMELFNIILKKIDTEAEKQESLK